MSDLYGFDEQSVKRIAQAVRKTEGQTFNGSGRGRGSNSPLVVVGKITSGSNPYAWSQQYAGTGAGLSDLTGGITGVVSPTKSAEAYEISGATDVPAGSLVLMVRTFIVESGTPRVVWAFSYVDPSSGGGTDIGHGLAYQVYSTGSDGTTTLWDYIRSHS